MKKIQLKFAGQQMTKEQMKIVVGGQRYSCYAVNPDGTNGSRVGIYGDNCCQAQANADSVAYSNQYTDTYPNGINCPCDDIC